MFTESDIVIIEYRKSNSQVSNFEVAGEVCKKIRDGSNYLIEIAKEMRINKYNS